MLTSPKAEPTILQISTGLALRYEKTGEGPPLVLLHTIRTQLEYFRDLAPVLAKSYTVYAIDLPGHGHSPIDPLARFDEPYFRQGVIRFHREAQPHRRHARRRIDRGCIGSHRGGRDSAAGQARRRGQPV